MSSVDIAAVITSVVALAAWGTLLRQLSEPADRKMLILLLLAALPLSPAVFHWIRLPLDAGLKGALGTDSTSYQFLRLCYAPLTEEPAKLIPLLLLLVPGCRGSITKQNTAGCGATNDAPCVGVGIGLTSATTSPTSRINATESRPIQNSRSIRRLRRFAHRAEP